MTVLPLAMPLISPEQFHNAFLNLTSISAVIVEMP